MLRRDAREVASACCASGRLHAKCEILRMVDRISDCDLDIPGARFTHWLPVSSVPSGPHDAPTIIMAQYSAISIYFRLLERPKPILAEVSAHEH